MNTEQPSLYGPAVTFDGVSLKLGKNLILHDISFAVAPGSIHCLLGPNGGGKTSLIRCLLGQMPHSGTIKVTWNTAKKITGYVPQSLDIDRTLPMTVGDFIAMICQQRPIFIGRSGRKKKLIMTALERVGMAEKINYTFGGLSGGERQRVLLAQALIPEPALLILDEPASGLDKKGAEIMQGLLRQINQDGATLLMIHHDIGEVRKLGDAVTCINQKVLFSGAPKTLLTPETILSIFSPNH
ncbi:MAG: manganese ABC transporter ATP-binding protein [Deltaproteobacteria bacterium]|nr:MAG: manganese ABC transporter ATP-binding protein [Deltaproteobacteria bacterium]